MGAGRARLADAAETARSVSRQRLGAAARCIGVSLALAEAGGVLKAVPVQELRWVRSVGVLHREEPYLSPAVRRFIEILTRITSSTAGEAVPVRL
jgi:DNA-binding transcriptional LysR family regulator